MKLLVISTVLLLSFFIPALEYFQEYFGMERNDGIELIELNKLESKPVAVSTRYYNVLVLIPKSTELLSLSPILKKDFVGFKEAIGFRESSGRYDIVSKTGYIGKYQFGKSSLYDMGIYDTDKFLKSAKAQEAAFIALCSMNKYRLRYFMPKYIGKVINGIELTESGMLAASHLLGAGAVIEFVKSDGNTVGSDGLGTTLVEYLEKFSGYDTSVISASRRMRVTI